MNFGQIPNGEALFLDANIFVYAFSRHPQYGVACRDLFERIDRSEVTGQTTTHVLSEMAHRLMTLEACSMFGWPMTGIAQRLRQHPAEVGSLSAYRQAVDTVLNSRIHVVLTQPEYVRAAAAISQSTGLLSNDALVVAVMQANAIRSIASHDADFDCVAGLTRFGPI